MSKVSVSITKEGTKKYPLHQHSYREIMYYLSGRGELATEKGGIPFEPGSIIIVPPKTVHGSVSEEGFVNISVGADFGNLFLLDKIVKITDSADKSGERIARLIYDNRHSGEEYLTSLTVAYAHFILQSIKLDKKITRAVADIVGEISKSFSDPRLELTPLLIKSGYAEDYIRTEFKRATGLTPTELLTKLRIEQAQKLFEIYGGNMSVSEIAEACGFDDPVYFSRRFKSLTGTSPSTYKKQTPR